MELLREFSDKHLSSCWRTVCIKTSVTSAAPDLQRVDTGVALEQRHCQNDAKVPLRYTVGGVNSNDYFEPIMAAFSDCNRQ
jgi:hypothetical protein